MRLDFLHPQNAECKRKNEKTQQQFRRSDSKIKAQDMCSQCDSIRIYLTLDWHLSDMEIKKWQNKIFTTIFFAIFFLI